MVRQQTQTNNRSARSLLFVARNNSIASRSVQTSQSASVVALTEGLKFDYTGTKT
jgi:hypothetical protein